MDVEEVDDENYRKAVTTQLQRFQASGELCDITIKTTSQDFTAHKAVLAASSDYFKALFTTQMQEKSCKEITLDLKAQTMTELLRYVYTGEFTFNESSVKELLMAADYLMITDLKDKAARSMSDFLSPEFCLQIRQFAERSNCSILKESTMRFIRQHFASITRLKEFECLEYETLEEAINSDDVIVEREEDVFEAVQRWVSVDMRNREKHFARLFSNVRLASISKEYLSDNVVTHPLVTNSLVCMRQILETLASSACKDDDVHEPRRCLRTHSQAIILTGGVTAGRTLTDTLAWLPDSDSWLTLRKLVGEREKHAVAVCRGFMYVIGGFNKPTAVDRYDPCSDTWSRVADLLEKAISPAAVTLDGNIYVLGGKDGFNTISTVQCYEPEIDAWRLSTPLSQRRKAHCAVVLQGEVYAIGGCTYDNDSLAAVEKLNPRQIGASWHVVSSLNHRRKYACAVGLTNRIMVAGGYQDTNSTALRSCEIYCREADQWQSIGPMVLARAAAGMAHVNGGVYVLGGRSDRCSISSVERYNESLDEWQVAEAVLPQACAWFQCIVAVVPKRRELAPIAQAHK